MCFKDISPVSITKLTPIQMPNVDMNQLKEGRKAFTKNEWIDVLLRSTGMEPDELSYCEKWLWYGGRVMSKFELINASCADQTVDAVVNAANDGVDVKLCAFTASEMKEAEHEYNSFAL